MISRQKMKIIEMDAAMENARSFEIEWEVNFHSARADGHSHRVACLCRHVKPGGQGERPNRGTRLERSN